MLDYPLKFIPILVEKIWGGNKLTTILNKHSDKEFIGESWELSDLPDHVSKVANGSLAGKSINELLSTYKDQLLGQKIYAAFGDHFPLLIKFIDAKKPLSVQLHPNDDLARKRHNTSGKTEMWYIMQADEGANIFIGFKETTTKDEYLKHLKANKITDLLNTEEVSKGNSFFINTGKVHAIGAGVLLAEIQQTSDITYRIYDWGRKDKDGHGRELHTELALDAINFEKKDDFKLHYQKKQNESSSLACCPYFTTNFLPVKGKLNKDYNQLDSFIIFMCVSGSCKIGINGNFENIQKGETVLIPARNKQVVIESEGCELLEVYIE
ncbi:class I mannose-6-phosphate isomerase [Marivirga sp. S37H4]|uniref:Phosphohexomutase n=1 Tax=Marivirga aurantiaca TaxID=2802615 RepID=A0A934WW10_9BACT|nr:type I phosphomannose isomerase catalytic subunit [Marivirga aurantiaca]MBK6264093.1 class I mannose-6-phosphate isomerase [Marivirga aurantiaca]